ncbi:MAG: RnfABCDGE type electron transport complex subunit C, partial [Ruminococcus sp.]|nr:RnfABCDGE type electron transport complex subunit C [Ruminococcus sp.]
MRLHGIKVQHKKNTADQAPVRLPVPDEVCIPMSMHIGKPARIVVKRGDEVKLGQLIGEQDGFVSVPVHASVSGTVSKIEDITMSTGQRVPAVFIKSDGKNELSEDIKPPVVNDFNGFVEAIKRSGVVGLGGAGFPTFVKVSVDDLSKVEAVVINAAECEPYITSDTRTMVDKPELVFKGIEAGKKYMGIKRFIIGIEDNKKEAIRIMKEYAAKTEGVEVHVLPSLYPQGGEKVLVYNTTGKVVPKGGLPLDVGIIVVNVTTLAFVAEYLETGMPLVEKCITVDGSAVKKPSNVIAPIGTPIEKLFEACEGLKCEPAKIIYGGPMMGIAVPSADTPVLKMTN